MHHEPVPSTSPPAPARRKIDRRACLRVACDHQRVCHPTSSPSHIIRAQIATHNRQPPIATTWEPCQHCPLRGVNIRNNRMAIRLRAPSRARAASIACSASCSLSVLGSCSRPAAARQVLRRPTSTQILQKRGFNEGHKLPEADVPPTTSPRRRIQVNGFWSDPFPLRSGVAQGCPLSHRLFSPRTGFAQG